MPDWGDLVRAYVEAQAGKEFGPGWREKIAMLRAQTARYEAEAEEAKRALRPKKYQVTVPDPVTKGPVVKLFNEEQLETGVPGYVAPPAPRKPEMHRVKIPDPARPGQFIEKLFTDEELRAGVAGYREPDKPQKPPDPMPGVARQMVVNGVLGDWFPETQRFVPSPAGARTIVDSRQDTQKKDLMDTLDSLLTETDADLKRYEATFEGGISRWIPSAAHPEKAVAKNAYLSRLQSMAQIFGRGILADNRVSNEDRQAYANTLGLQGEIIMTLEPAEARRRLQFMRDLITRKYGRLMADGNGNPQNAAGSPDPGAAGGTDLGGLDPTLLDPLEPRVR